MMARKTTKRKGTPSRKTGGAKEKPLSFEQALDRLEALVAKLEEGEVPLEESLQAYVEGTRLVRECMERLRSAEATIQRLSEDGEGFRLEEGLGEEEETGDGGEDEDDEEDDDDEDGQDELPF